LDDWKNRSGLSRGNLANPQTGIDGKYESETISLGVASGFDDPKHASNIVFREH
jgi:hypothetical protein